MKTATATLKSLSPYGQNAYIQTPKLDKETSADFEKRTWRDRLHTTPEGNVFIPPMAVKPVLRRAFRVAIPPLGGWGGCIEGTGFRVEVHRPDHFAFEIVLILDDPVDDQPPPLPGDYVPELPLTAAPPRPPEQ